MQQEDFTVEKTRHELVRRYTINGIEVLDIAVLPDGHHAIVIGTAIPSHEELQPVLSRTEKRVMSMLACVFFATLKCLQSIDSQISVSCGEYEAILFSCNSLKV